MAKEKRVNEDLRQRRIRLVGDGRGAIARCARLLNTPYRTYQDWELGTAAAPGAVLVALDALQLLVDLRRTVTEVIDAGMVLPPPAGGDDKLIDRLDESLEQVDTRFGALPD